MSYKPGEKVKVWFEDAGEWTDGIVMADHKGHVLCHVDRPSVFGSPLMAKSVPIKPIVMAKSCNVKPADEAA